MRGERQAQYEKRRTERSVRTPEAIKARVTLDRANLSEEFDMAFDRRAGKFRTKARDFSALLTDFKVLSAESIHISGRSVEVADHAVTVRRFHEIFDLADNRVFATVLNKLALMSGNSAERAAAKASAMRLNSRADDLDRWDWLCIRGMRFSRKGKRVDCVHFFFRKWIGRWVDNDRFFSAFLQ